MLQQSMQIQQSYGQANMRAFGKTPVSHLGPVQTAHTPSAPPMAVRTTPYPAATGFGPPYPAAAAPVYYSDTGVSLNNTEDVPSSKVELHIACRNLLDLDIFSKSDPMVVMFIEVRSGKKKHWHQYGTTEMIKDSLDPDFVKSMIIDYHFEEIQRLKFEVYDVDSTSKNLSDHDFIGSAECTVGSILGEGGGRYQKQLLTTSGKPAGLIIISAEELSSCKEIALLHFKGKKLDKKDFFGLSDPFLVFYRCNEDNSFTAVHKTEVLKNTLNPTWKPFKIPVRTLCNGDYHRTVKIACYDWDSDGGHDLIGEFQTNLNDLKENSGQSLSSYELINVKKKAKKKKYHNSGIIQLLQFKLEMEPSFLDYVKGGTELCFSVAVDFTASNGNPAVPSSLHFRNPYDPNAYVQALMAVGQICQDYDTDKLFPAFGFGAKIPPAGYASHEFALNGLNDPNCFGVDGIIQAYNQALDRVELYGPTNFAPVIKSTARIAADAEKHAFGKQYFIVLILTDGIISDMDQTKEAIVAASSLPISIIIVGIGNAEFDAMEELDGDDDRLFSRGRYAERDIVQFVPFRNFSGPNQMAGQALAREVLAEVPGQLTSYMKSKGIQPIVGSVS